MQENSYKMTTNILFKNMEGFYKALQCPKCKKVIFCKLTEELKRQISMGVPPKCCECLVELEGVYLVDGCPLETAKVEIEL